ncbi:MAG: substrate-binding domain-containing protein [Muribaculaceae bacterium]|nr:substrate-binding domain-containing protein [Muribaculaceae bacterium]
MKKNNYIALFALVALAALVASCGKFDKKTPAKSGDARVICDESFRNILDQEIDVFHYHYPDANIMVDYLGETEAYDSLMNNKVDLIITSLDLTDSQKSFLKDKGRAYRSRMIAVDAVAIIVNNSNAVEQLTMAELTDIMNGKHRAWDRYSTNRTGRDTIQLVFDKNTSGIVHYMRTKFLKGKQFPFEVYSEESSEKVFKAVESHKNAIGFVGVSWVTSNMESAAIDTQNSSDTITQSEFTNRIKVLKLRDYDSLVGYKPYQEHINSGDYPLVRPIYAIDASPLGTLEHSLFVFLTSNDGQKIILQTGIMPGNVPVRIVEVQ